jgi:hypothetical protein
VWNSLLRSAGGQEYITLIILNLIFGKTMSGLKNIFLVLVFSGLFGCSASLEKVSEVSLEEPETGVFGRIEGAEVAADQLWVYAYRDQQNSFRGPAEYAARAEKDASYVLDLPPGKWFLLARSRNQNSLSGPPQSGATWAIYQQNPLSVEAGQVKRVDFQLQPVVLGQVVAQSTDTGFSGRVIGPDRKPLASAVVMAYVDLEFRRKPDSLSLTGSDGSFLLPVARAGTYCLLVRQSGRGQLKQGELFGLLAEGEAGCRQLQMQQILDVGTIQLQPYLR